jgi:hypothetical protein
VQFKLQFQRLGLYIKELADFINQLPFFVPPNGIIKFNDFNVAYKELHAHYIAIAEYGLSAELERCSQITLEASTYVHTMLRDVITSLKDDVVIVSNRFNTNIKEQFIELIALQEELFAISISNDPDIETIYLTKKHTIEQKLATVFGLIAGLQDGLNKNLQLKHITPTGKIGRALGSHFMPAKELQHKLFAAKQLQTDFSCLYREPKITVVTTEKFLDLADYIELTLLTQLLKPEHVSTALANKLAIIQISNEQLIEKVKQLQWLDLLKIARLQRIMNVYLGLSHK